MIELEPKYSPYNDCMENQIYTILSGMGCINELAYIDSLRINFDIDSYTYLKWTRIGELIRDNHDCYKKSIENIWNIEFSLIQCNQQNLGIQIKELLAKELPLIAFIDSYWCPWEVSLYKKHKNFIHGFIIKGVFDDGYICTDGHRGIKECYISKKDLHSGCTGNILTMQMHDDISNDLSWNKIMGPLIKRETDMPSWRNIQYFKNVVTHDLDIERELEGYKTDFITIQRAPLIQALRKIKNDRRKFSWCIRSLQKYFHLEHRNELSNVADLSNSSAEHWKLIAVLFIKYSYSLSINHKNKIQHLLNEIIKSEKCIIESMLRFHENNFNR